MTNLQEALRDFASQPYGMFGALCIMLAVTAFNSLKMKAWVARSGLGDRAIALLLNALNLSGGVLLLVNAVERREIVWEVLEVYFVLIALKGLVQDAGARPQREDQERAVVP